MVLEAAGVMENFAIVMENAPNAVCRVSATFGNRLLVPCSYQKA